MRDAPPRLSIDLFDSTLDEVLYLREPDTLDAQDAPAADDRLASPALPLPLLSSTPVAPFYPGMDLWDHSPSVVALPDFQRPPLDHRS